MQHRWFSGLLKNLKMRNTGDGTQQLHLWSSLCHFPIRFSLPLTTIHCLCHYVTCHLKYCLWKLCDVIKFLSFVSFCSFVFLLSFLQKQYFNFSVKEPAAITELLPLTLNIFSTFLYNVLWSLEGNGKIHGLFVYLHVFALISVSWKADLP